MNPLGVPDLLFIGLQVKEPWRPEENWNPDKQAGVVEVCSVSDCLSERPPDWVQHWTHNRSWSYSTPEQALATIPAGETGKYDLFAYWVAPRTFIGGAWEDLDPGTLFHSDLPPLPAGPGPAECDVLGFDVVTWGNHQLGCSPLSCNSLAKKFKVNPYCLVDDMEVALRLVASFDSEACEPGPFLAVRVARVAVGRSR